MLGLLQYRAWLLDEGYYDRVHSLISERIRHGHDLSGLVRKQTPEDIEALISTYLSAEVGHPPVGAAMELTVEYDEPTGLRTVTANGKRIALITMVGPLTKRGDLCAYGMMHYQQMLNRVNASTHIDGTVLIIDTPSGTVDGTPELGLAIRTSPKPVGVFGDGLVASAGMWLASQSQVIVGNRNNPTRFGSIGVLMILPNYQNVMDAGYFPRMTIYRAEQSHEKALINTIEPISEEGERQLQADLNGIASMFIDTVKSGRGAKLDTSAKGLFTGRTFDAHESHKIGLIDSLGTLHTAVTKVAELARQQAREKALTEETMDE